MHNLITVYLRLLKASFIGTYFQYCLSISTISDNFELVIVNKYNYNISYSLLCTITALIFTFFFLPKIILFAAYFTCVPFKHQLVNISQ
jgi:hypothetical protein